MFVMTIVIAILIGYMRHGKLKNLENLTIRLWYVLSLAFLIQILALRIENLSDIQFYLLHMSSYVIIMYICWVNRHKIAIRIMAIGNLFNGLVIALNNGKMPVKVPASIVDPVFDRGHILLDTTTRISMLGDILYIRIPTIKIYMLSVGDIFLMIGVFLLIQQGMTCVHKENK